MKYINNMLKNNIPLGHAFNVLLVSNNIRNVAQIEYYLWQKRNKILMYLKKILEKNNIEYIDNRKEEVLVIYNNTIQINNKKLNDDIYDMNYVGKLLDLGCATNDLKKLYSRKENAPFQVRFMVKYKNDIKEFMAQMCIDDKTLSKSHKQITKFRKEIEKLKLNFHVYMEIDPQPMYYTKNRTPVYN